LRTEKMIQRIIDKISKNSTVIIIAHRLSTIQNVDRVLKLKDSSILSN
jgi:ABC-type multidrug transport system fused ATPase/permease subunit